jgi:hypothetical protein
MGRQYTIYLDEISATKLKELPIGNSRSDKIRYAIMQLDPTVAALTDSLLVFKKNMDRFLAKNPEIYDQYNQFIFGPQIFVEVEE